MAVDKDERNGQWRYRRRVVLPDGRRFRLTGTPLINTRRAAEEAERAHIERVLRGKSAKRVVLREVPTFRDFAKTFQEISLTKNKPSEIKNKETILRVHLVPMFGAKRLNDISFANIQDYVAVKTASGLAKKSINNHLAVLRGLLTMAKKRGLVTAIPEVEWLKAPKPEFDFYDFDEARRLVDAAKLGNPQIAVMLLLALRTGLRHGELLALRWEDVDFVTGTVHVRQALSMNVICSPKNNKHRSIPLSQEALVTLKGHRHLRGKFVFCHDDGQRMDRYHCQSALETACKRAGLRQLGWHALRHSFASHLTIQGVPLKAVQELLGHGTMEMTMRYAHLTPHVTKNAVQLLDNPAKLPNEWATGGQQAEKMS